MNGARVSFDRELEELEVLRQERPQQRPEQNTAKTPGKASKKRQIGASISPTIQQNDELAGSFKNSVNRVNGVKGVRHRLDQPLPGEEAGDAAKPRNSPALQRYKVTTKTNQDNLTEEDIEKLKVARAESRKFALSGTSLTSSKTQKLWESLDDIEVIRGQDPHLPTSDLNPLEAPKMAVVPGHQKETNGESLRDLVPAGLKGVTDMTVVEPSYTVVGESLRRNTPTEVQCSMFCGGRRCKYEGADSWSPSETALVGIYSHWITNDLLAMARPNTKQMEEHDILGQFDRLGIRSMINLQMPGEHASCGPKLEASGFTYNPDMFMKNKIFYFNFVWKDFSETSMASLLDMVKVVSFALQEGKVAVHCHAGLGRTGVLLACYLVYYIRVRSNDAIRYVRLKRPNMVQTRRQIQCVKEFETYFLPQCVVYSQKPPGERDKKLGRFPIETCLKRQKYLLHGFEARALKHIPKILHVICERLIKLCDSGENVYDANVSNFSQNFLIYKIIHAERVLRKSSMQEVTREESTESTTPSNGTMSTRLSEMTPVDSSRSEMGMEPRLAELAHKMPDWNSSQSLLSENSANTTPGYTRPASETNSLGQSCSSALSGVDDSRLDELLGDGIKGQRLNENKVALELASHMDLQKAAQEERLPIYSAEQVGESLLANHRDVGGHSKAPQYAKGWTSKLREYQKDLNYRMSSWDMLATETSLPILSTLIFEWLEHLKTPMIDKDGVINIVLLSSNLEKALGRMTANQAYIVEYLVRMVARLQPLPREQAEKIMKRLVASLTHQSVPLGDVTVPFGKNLPKMRPGTFASCLNLFMSLYDAVVEADGLLQENSDRNPEDMSLNSSAEFPSNNGLPLNSELGEKEKEVHTVMVEVNPKSQEISDTNNAIIDNL